MVRRDRHQRAIRVCAEANQMAVAARYEPPAARRFVRDARSYNATSDDVIGLGEAANLLESAAATRDFLQRFVSPSASRSARKAARRASEAILRLSAAVSALNSHLKRQEALQKLGRSQTR